MKRFTGILAAATIALAPMSASALEALTDNAMNDVRAQAGVSIALDDIVIYQTGIADTTYTDTDGMSKGAPEGQPTTVGAVTSAGVKIAYDGAIQKLTIIDGITSDIDKAGAYSAATLAAAFANTTPTTVDDAPAVGFYSTADIVAGLGAGTPVVDPTNGNNADNDYRTGASPLTIDVGTCQSLTAGFNYNYGGTAPADIAGVIIGLPTIEIQSFHTDDTKTISLVSTDASAVNADDEFIQITKSGSSTMAILGGRVEIAPH